VIQIESADVALVRRLIAETKHEGLTDHEARALDISLAITQKVWVGILDGECACAWGLIPPTLLSSQAHLWLYTTKLIEGNEFLFWRCSQRAIEDMLKEYPLITGVADPAAPKSIRWLRCLGATFGEPQGKLIPFFIRAK
jgi:hypothetical protein